MQCTQNQLCGVDVCIPTLQDSRNPDGDCDVVNVYIVVLEYKENYSLHLLSYHKKEKKTRASLTSVYFCEVRLKKERVWLPTVFLHSPLRVKFKSIACKLLER